MKPLQSRNRIAELMGTFVAQVESAGAMRQTDINLVAESVLIPLLGEVYGFKNLKNLNIEQANFPGVDLGDEKARVAVQVTSTPNAEKIKETLRKFVNHGLHTKFDRVMVYVLTRKQGSYSGRGYDEIIGGGRFRFDRERDILDFRDVMAVIGTLSLPKLQRIEGVLEAIFGNGNTLALEGEPEAKVETLHLNLLEMSFPEELYVADLRTDLGREARTSKQPGRKIEASPDLQSVENASVSPARANGYANTWPRMGESLRPIGNVTAARF